MQIDQNIIVFIQVNANRRFCIKNLDENNNILGLDISELRFGGVQNSSSSWKLDLELRRSESRHMDYNMYKCES